MFRLANPWLKCNKKQRQACSLSPKFTLRNPRKKSPIAKFKVGTSRRRVLKGEKFP